MDAAEAGFATAEGPLANFAGLASAPLALRVGPGLGGLLAGEGPFLREVATVRGVVATLAGFVLPGLELQDGPELPSMAYELRVHGGSVGRGQVYPGLYFHALPGQGGSPHRHPVDGTPGRWAVEAPAREAESHTAAAVLAEHLQDLALRHAGWLLSLDELTAMLKALAKRFPESTGGSDEATHVALWNGARYLLQEGLSVRRLERLAATLKAVRAEGLPWAEQAEALRRRAVPEMAYAWLGSDGVLAAFPLSPRLSGALRDRVVSSAEGPNLAASAAWERSLVSKMTEAVAAAGSEGGRPVILVPEAPMRRALGLAMARAWPTWPPPAVLLEDEVPRHLPHERFPELPAPNTKPV